MLGKRDDCFEQSACNTKFLILHSLFQMCENQKWHSKHPRNWQGIGRDPTFNVARSIDNARATAGYRKRVEKSRANALSIQFLSISLFCLVGKPPILPALPNGPSSPAPCEKVATKLFQSEKVTGLPKMHRNHIFSLRTCKTLS